MRSVYSQPISLRRSCINADEVASQAFGDQFRRQLGGQDHDARRYRWPRPSPALA